MFRGLMKAIAPQVKRGLVTLGKEALNAGVNTLQDVSQGTSVKDALRKQRSVVTGNLKRKAMNKAKSLVSSSINSKSTSRISPSRKRKRTGASKRAVSLKRVGASKRPVKRRRLAPLVI